MGTALWSRNVPADRGAPSTQGAQDRDLPLPRQYGPVERERQPRTRGREVLEVGALKVDTSSRRTWLNDVELNLPLKEFELLTCLIRNHGIVLSRDLRIDRVWGTDFVGDRRTIDVHIRWLREKIEVDPAQPRYIQTVRGIGYRYRHWYSTPSPNYNAPCASPPLSFHTISE